jgi:hypothetical protein
MVSGQRRLSRAEAERIAEAGDAALAAEDLSHAIALFNEAEPGVADPDRCAGGRWMAWMLAGDFEAAWRESDAIRRHRRPDPHRFWNGEDLRGRRVILRSLHGFGDAVQMFRFLPRLRQLTASLTVEVAPRLVELARCFDGIGEVITWGPDAPLEPPLWDVQIEIMELPYVLRATADALLPQQDYLHVPPSMRDHVARVLGPQRNPRVGIAWCAGHWNPSRSIPFAEMVALLEVGNVEFWSLQGEPERAAWTALGSPYTQHDVYACGDGLLSLAAVVAQLDLVITVDTLPAHLAGALGVPCWVMLQRQADWRWMSGREDSPWYRSLRLLRQGKQGDWNGLIARVREELRRELGRG